MKDIIKEFIEKGADLEHSRWAKWQKYMHSKMDDGYNKAFEKIGWILPTEFFERWERQIKTKYKDLTEKEKDSDREQVEVYIPLLHKALATQKQEIIKDIENHLKNGEEICGYKEMESTRIFANTIIDKIKEM